ncbi:hypothetical protein E4U40_004658 [Claviceps sp. LM458 group G5]|nr:hypothetical protein E4U40_004658 [Claviceps sp. LM458 group G5]
MTLSSGFHMPGAFNADGILYQGLFRPPASSASSSAYLPPTRSSAETSTPKRKRVRDDWRQTELATKIQNDSFLDYDELNANTFLVTPVSRYSAPNGRACTIAGQLGTPGCGLADSDVLGDSVFSDKDYRRALGSKRPRDSIDGESNSLFSSSQHPYSQSSRWSSLALSTLGGVVGKVWEFCKAGAFKGFHAGGNKGGGGGPEKRVSAPGGSMTDWPWHPNNDYDGLVDHQHIPGHFPEGNCYNRGDVISDSKIGSGASTPSTPAAKRRQTAPMDELGRSWVMVQHQERVGESGGTRRARGMPPNKSPSRHRNQGPSAVTGRRISTPNQRRAPGRPVAGAGTYRASPQPTSLYPTISQHSAWDAPLSSSSASFASPRCASPMKLSSLASPMAASLGSPTPAMSRGHSRRRSNAGSQSKFTHKRTHSNASTASSRGTVDDVDNSPRLTPEAKQLAARRYQEERDADVRIAAFNKQLQDMIRLGKEALGTRIEVDGEFAEEGGWEDY